MQILYLFECFISFSDLPARPASGSHIFKSFQTIMSIRFDAQARAILQEAAMKLGELGYYARIELGLVPASEEDVLTLNVASSLIGLAQVEELLLSGQAQIESRTSKLGLLKFIARSHERSTDPDFVAGVVGPVQQVSSPGSEHDAERRDRHLAGVEMGNR